MEIWKSGYCDPEVQKCPTKPTRVKLEPTSVNLELLRELRAITGLGWKTCTELVQQGLEFKVTPDVWQRFTTSMDQFACWWARLYPDEPDERPFMGPSTVVCQLHTRPEAQTCLVLADILQTYAETTLDQSTRNVIIGAAIHSGHPFTITEALWPEFNDLMDGLPQVKWTALSPPCTG